MIENQKELNKVISALKKLNGKVFHYDDFEDKKLGRFGKTLVSDGYVFKCKKAIDTLFEEDTQIHEAFNGHFRGFTFCKYECDTKFFPNKFDEEPSLTVLQADERIYVVGYSKGWEI